jgi:hypothetical protein
MKLETFWMIANYSGVYNGVMEGTNCRTREDAIKHFSESWVATWDQCKEEGFEVIEFECRSES